MTRRFVLLALLSLGVPSFSAPPPEATALFQLTCAPCHGKDGRARTPMARKLGVKDLTLSKIPEAEVVRQIREGRKDAQGKQQMPAFGDRLSEQEIRKLVEVVKSLRR